MLSTSPTLTTCVHSPVALAADLGDLRPPPPLQTGGGHAGRCPSQVAWPASSSRALPASHPGSRPDCRSRREAHCLPEPRARQGSRRPVSFPPPVSGRPLQDAGSQQIGFLLGSCGVTVALTSDACHKGLPKSPTGEIPQFKGTSAPCPRRALHRALCPCVPDALAAQGCLLTHSVPTAVRRDNCQPLLSTCVWRCARGTPIGGGSGRCSPSRDSSSLCQVGQSCCGSSPSQNTSPNRLGTGSPTLKMRIMTRHTSRSVAGAPIPDTDAAPS